MSKTPGMIIPSAYSSEEELKEDLQRRSQEAGYTPFGADNFSHSTDSVDDFLEHYGVKGMKWGVRKAPSAKRLAKEKKYGSKGNRTAAQKRAVSARRTRRTNNAFAVAAGALYVGMLLADMGTNSGRPRPNMNDYRKPSKSVSDLINEERNVKVDSINRTFKEGFIDEAQRDNFVNAMNKRYDKKVSEAKAKK